MRRFFILAAAATMLLLASCSQQPMTPEAASPGDELRPAANPTELFFSEVIEGSSNNKALEIYNGTGGSVDLNAGGYNVQIFFNGNASAGLTINLTGTVADGDVYVIAQSSANATILAQADQTNGAGWYNGDDAVVLRKGTTVIDAIGQIGFDPGSEWGTGLVSTADNTLRRKADVCAGDADGYNAFDPAVEWDGYATDTVDGLGAHTASCGGVVDLPPTLDSSTPANGSTIASGDASIGVTFSEPVSVSTSAFVLSCASAGSVDMVVSGGGSTYSIDPVVDLSERDACELTVQATEVTDLDGAPDTMTDDAVIAFDVGYRLCGSWILPTYAIQGSGSTAAITGPAVTGGVVIGDYEGASPTLRGFYLQDATGDADPDTSDGIFVFNGSNDSVNLGDLVVVTGTAAEFQGQTQVSASSITSCGTGGVTPVDVTLPVPSADYLERYEGMLVAFPQTLYVTEMFQLGRFGQVVMSSGDRLPQPTSVALPGAAALAVQAANDLNRIIVDDDRNDQNPDPILFGRGGAPLSASNTLRGGDTATGMVGVLGYTWAGNSASGNAYRLRPVNALGGTVSFEPTNERTTEAPDVGGSLRVAGFNLLNYFDTFDGLPDTVDNCSNGVGGAPTDCRGADTAFEFDRQWPKTVAAIVGLDVDVLAVTELENDGYGPSSAIADLTDRLNAATAPGTWAFVDADAATGEVNALGLDAIKVGILYRPAAVTPVGQTAALNTEAFVTGGDADLRNRPALAQAFADNATGATFIAVANHLKSKGSACEAPDAGDGQGNCNAVRVNAVQELVAWLGTDPTGTGDPDVLLLGDYNSYAMEDPIQELLGEGFVDLQRAYGGMNAYTYVFDGQWGSLDQALASPSLEGQVTGTAAWHVNADEPSVLDYNTDFKSAGQITSLYASDAFRTSDHDPLVVGLDLGGPNCVAATPSRTSLWPVNHKFVAVSIDVPHSDGSNVTVVIDSIFQDELVDAPGTLDGSTSPDASGLGEAVAQLRAERYEGGNGRVYHVGFTAQDALGQTCSGTVLVTVPSSQGRNGAAVDDGPLYDATID